MASVTVDQLKKEIKEILKDADLTTLSAKKVRQQLEEILSCDLSQRKKEIDALVMEYVNANEENNDGDDSEKSSAGEEDDEEDEEEEEQSEPEVKKPAKRTAAARKSTSTTKKKKHNSSDEDESGSEDSGASDEEYSPKKTSAAKPKKKGGRRKKESDSDSDEEWKKPKKAKKAGGGGGKGKGTGFTRAYTLSPELAALMGAESLPRHEVVKKMWAMVKERNLYDPKNKQYAICDQDLIKVIGVKRFRTFAMLKYLKQHFID